MMFQSQWDTTDRCLASHTATNSAAMYEAMNMQMAALGQSMQKLTQSLTALGEALQQLEE